MAKGAQASRASKNLIYSGNKTAARMPSYSAKRARMGMDIGKPGKNFSKIEAKATKRYGSKAAGKRVAGAVLAKLRRG